MLCRSDHPRGFQAPGVTNSIRLLCFNRQAALPSLSCWKATEEENSHKLPHPDGHTLSRLSDDHRIRGYTIVDRKTRLKKNTVQDREGVDCILERDKNQKEGVNLKNIQHLYYTINFQFIFYIRDIPLYFLVSTPFLVVLYFIVLKV